MVAIRTKPVPPTAAAPKPTLLNVRVTENDPTLSVKATTPSSFQISGTANNRGFVASTMNLEFSGQKISLKLDAGDTSETVLTKIKQALPEGFAAVELARAKRLPPDLTIGITPVKVGSAALQPAKIPLNITGPNAGASLAASLFRNAMPGPGPRATTAAASLTVSGTGFNDAPPKYGIKEVRVYEQGSNKLVMTLKSPKVAETTHRRGSTQQSYSFKVPLAGLDAKKQYTFAANTSINGAAAQWVRSDYFAMQSAF